MQQLAPPVLKPYLRSLGLRPDYWTRNTLAPKWALLPRGIVEWHYKPKPKQMGAA